jgi:ferritin
MREKDFAAVVEMQWFVTEQVEEEKSARDIIAKLEMAGSDARALLEIDRELGARAGLPGGKGPGQGRPSH